MVVIDPTGVFGLSDHFLTSEYCSVDTQHLPVSGPNGVFPGYIPAFRGITAP